eukprot:713973-Amphidinium_carterae.1
MLLRVLMEDPCGTFHSNRKSCMCICRISSPQSHAPKLELAKSAHNTKMLGTSSVSVLVYGDLGSGAHVAAGSHDSMRGHDVLREIAR